MDPRDEPEDDTYPLSTFAFEAGEDAVAAHQRQQELELGSGFAARQRKPQRMKERFALGPRFSLSGLRSIPTTSLRSKARAAERTPPRR